MLLFCYFSKNLFFYIFKYGTGENKAEMSEADFARLIEGLKKYDEDDLKQHQKKLWCLIGLSTGTRGQEQHLLEV